MQRRIRKPPYWFFETNQFFVFQSEIEALNNKNNLEVFQAAMGNSNYGLPYSFPTPSQYLLPQHSGQNNHPQPGGGGTGDGGGGGMANAMLSSASSHSSESSQGSARNGIETRERESSNHSQGNGQGNSHQQQTNWSFEEQFKQVRQASTLFYTFSKCPQLKFLHLLIPNATRFDIPLIISTW